MAPICHHSDTLLSSVLKINTVYHAETISVLLKKYFQNPSQVLVQFWFQGFDHRQYVKAKLKTLDHPLVAGCSIGPELHLFHYIRWDSSQNKNSKQPLNTFFPYGLSHFMLFLTCCYTVHSSVHFPDQVGFNLLFDAIKTG